MKLYYEMLAFYRAIICLNPKRYATVVSNIVQRGQLLRPLEGIDFDCA